MTSNSLRQNLSTIVALGHRRRIHNNKFEGLPFYCEYSRLEPSAEDCCFNHVLGLPISSTNVLPSPIWQWQYDHIIKHLENNKYNFILKATGIGLSEIALRWILFKSLVNDKWSNGIVPIFTGVNYDLARRLIDRAAQMLYPHFGRGVKENERIIRINGVEITAFPGGHMDSARSLTNTRMFFLDEFDFFEEEKNIESSRKIAERQIGKSDTDILIATTPNRPGGPAETLQQEANSLYNKIMLPYTLGLGTIYSESQIKENMKSPSFEQEYNLKYLGGIGNIFNAQEIDACIEEDYDIPTGSTHFTSYAGIDPGYGSSKFAIVVLIWRDNAMQVVETHNIANILYTDSLRLIDEIIARWGICKLYIDASGSHIIRQLCDTYQSGAYKNYELLTSEQLKTFRRSSCRSPLVVPIPFSTEHKNMLKNLQECISLKTIRIHPQFDELITALKSAQSKEGDQYSLDKTKSANNDLTDALRLALESVGG